MDLIQLEMTMKKYYGLLTILCVIIGFNFPQLSIFSPYIPLFLAALVFFMVIENNVNDFKQILKHPRSVLALLTSNLILYPAIGIIAGAYFLVVPHDVYVGILLLCFAPSPVVAALWSEMSGGDGAISVTTALTSMFLSIAIYPIVLYFLGVTSIGVAFEVFKLLGLSIFQQLLLCF